MKKRILIIGPTPPPYNGMSVVTETILSSSLQDRFHLLHLDIADRRGLENIGKLDFGNVYIALLHFAKIMHLLTTERIDLVYIPIAQKKLGYLRDCLFLVPTTLFRKKFVVHLHGGYFREFYQHSHKIMQLVINQTLRGTKRAIILGDTFKHIFDGLIPPERIAVVPNGVDVNGLYHEKSIISIESQKNNRLKVLFLGSLMKSKGFMDLLKAISEVVVKTKDIEFIFAGAMRSDREKQETMSFISQQSLSPFVTFPGVVIGKQKLELLCSSDIFAFPAYNEGQPLVLLEAMAAGLPIVTTNVGCIKETVINNANGFIVEKQNPKQIAKKIISLIEDEEMRIRMGKKSRELFLKHYTADRFVQNLGRVFEEVLTE